MCIVAHNSASDEAARVVIERDARQTAVSQELTALLF